jgi:hypothetical protein
MRGMHENKQRTGGGHLTKTDLTGTDLIRHSTCRCHVLTLVPLLCLYFSLVRVRVGVRILCVVLCFCISVFGLVWFPIRGSCLSLSLIENHDLWVVVFCLCVCSRHNFLVFVRSLVILFLCSV